jgi:NitT/TauT family transport system substrate-binding protein
MSTRHASQISRRMFLSGLTLAGTAGLLGLPPRPVAAEPPPETTILRLVKSPGLCLAPQYVAEELLQDEGFTDVQYLAKGRVEANEALASGEVHIDMAFVGGSIVQVDQEDPVVLLAGVHVGCFELFGTAHVRAMRDLRGKTVGVTMLGSGRHLFLASVLAYVGFDPGKDVNFVTHPAAEAMRLLAAGKIDAYQAFAQEAQELRAKQIGHVVVNSTVDRPWSQYFCCMVVANREFVRHHPVATKRALRAILKAADICALEPERSARFLVDRGYTTQYDYALQTMREIPYNRWREYSPEDTVRFYALRLHEVGMITSTPQQIIARGTDWRFFDALKQELKG